MINEIKYVISYSYSHLHSSSGARVRLLNSKYLKNDNWTIITSKLSNTKEENVTSINNFVDNLFKPISYSNTISKRSIKKIFGKILWPDRGIFWSSKIFFLLLIKILNSNNKYKLVGVGYPFSSILCAATLKFFFRKRIKFTAHFIDGFSLVSNKTIDRIAESFVLKNADHIIVCIDKENEFKKIFKQYCNKVTFVPTMIGIDVSNHTIPSTYNIRNKHFFGGSLYKNIRNPEKVFEIYKHLKNINLTIAGNANDCIDIVDKSKHIDYIGLVDQSKLINEIESSDVLINIDNQSDNEQSPGKIVEYMEFQKPILNFYLKKSLSEKILKKYDMSKASLSIDINENISENINKIRNFQEHIKTLTGKLYSTPDTIKQMYDLYNQ
ncbi:hypothetical protein [Halobacteriovorax sp.]|uniref:hypothetical protein n=1 Tax=Halobacteriovorax sp. TaxID=2020862 RepID=UPI003AF259CF